MPGWIRNLVMIVALGGWAATIVAYLLQGQFPGPALLGVPGGLYIAIGPGLPALPTRRRNPPTGSES